MYSLFLKILTAFLGQFIQRTSETYNQSNPNHIARLTLAKSLFLFLFSSKPVIEGKQITSKTSFPEGI